MKKLILLFLLIRCIPCLSAELAQVSSQQAPTVFKKSSGYFFSPYVSAAKYRLQNMFSRPSNAPSVAYIGIPIATYNAEQQKLTLKFLSEDSGKPLAKHSWKDVFSYQLSPQKKYLLVVGKQMDSMATRAGGRVIGRHAAEDIIRLIETSTLTEITSFSGSLSKSYYITHQFSPDEKSLIIGTRYSGVKSIVGWDINRKDFSDIAESLRYIIFDIESKEILKTSDSINALRYDQTNQMFVKYNDGKLGKINISRNASLSFLQRILNIVKKQPTTFITEEPVNVNVFPMPMAEYSIQENELTATISDGKSHIFKKVVSYSFSPKEKFLLINKISSDSLLQSAADIEKTLEGSKQVTTQTILFDLNQGTQSPVAKNVITYEFSPDEKTLLVLAPSVLISAPSIKSILPQSIKSTLPTQGFFYQAFLNDTQTLVSLGDKAINAQAAYIDQDNNIDIIDSQGNKTVTKLTTKERPNDGAGPQATQSETPGQAVLARGWESVIGAAKGAWQAGMQQANEAYNAGMRYIAHQAGLTRPEKKQELQSQKEELSEKSMLSEQEINEVKKDYEKSTAPKQGISLEEYLQLYQEKKRESLKNQEKELLNVQEPLVLQPAQEVPKLPEVEKQPAKKETTIQDLMDEFSKFHVDLEPSRDLQEGGRINKQVQSNVVAIVDRLTKVTENERSDFFERYNKFSKEEKQIFCRFFFANMEETFGIDKQTYDVYSNDGRYRANKVKDGRAIQLFVAQPAGGWSFVSEIIPNKSKDFSTILDFRFIITGPPLYNVYLFFVDDENYDIGVINVQTEIAKQKERVSTQDAPIPPVLQEKPAQKSVKVPKDADIGASEKEAKPAKEQTAIQGLMDEFMKSHVDLLSLQDLEKGRWINKQVGSNVGAIVDILTKGIENERSDFFEWYNKFRKEEKKIFCRFFFADIEERFGIHKQGYDIYSKDGKYRASRVKDGRAIQLFVAQPAGGWLFAGEIIPNKPKAFSNIIDFGFVMIGASFYSTYIFFVDAKYNIGIINVREELERLQPNNQEFSIEQKKEVPLQIAPNVIEEQKRQKEQLGKAEQDAERKQHEEAQRLEEERKKQQLEAEAQERALQAELEAAKQAAAKKAWDESPEGQEEKRQLELDAAEQEAAKKAWEESSEGQEEKRQLEQIELDAAEQKAAEKAYKEQLEREREGSAV